MGEGEADWRKTLQTNGVCMSERECVHVCVFACTFVGGLMWVCACVFSYINSDEHNSGQLSG